MHKDILDAIVKICRQRIADGDCPSVPAASVEALEYAVDHLAAMHERTLSTPRAAPAGQSSAQPAAERVHVKSCNTWAEEKVCSQPYTWDGDVPYCDICGPYRQNVATPPAAGLAEDYDDINEEDFARLLEVLPQDKPTRRRIMSSIAPLLKQARLSATPPGPPTGLYLNRDDGVAVEVTAEMLARAPWPLAWATYSDELKKQLTARGQEIIDALLKGPPNG